MENLKLETIIPSSISEISYANQESEFGGYSIALHRPGSGEKGNEYQIKVNNLDSKDSEKCLEMNRGLLHGQEGQGQALKTHLGLQSYNMVKDENMVPKPEKIQYKEKVTGYEINKQCFSEEELLKAFRIFDIGKDDLITEEDLIFVLDYIQEDYTLQQVQEMINMLSSDHKNVTFSDFKQLGQGHIVPLANLKMPDSDSKAKQQVLNNLEEHELLDEDPTQMMELLKNGTISYNRFEEHKNKAKNNHNTFLSKNKNKQFSKFLQSVSLSSPEEFRSRKQLFNIKVSTDVRDILKAQSVHRQRNISIPEIAKLLQISQKQARQLYPSSKQNPATEQEVLMEVIAFSREKILDKFEMCASLVNDRETIQFCEVVHILQILRGKDPSCANKLKAICRNMGLSIENHTQMNKIEISDILGSHLSVFFF